MRELTCTVAPSGRDPRGPSRRAWHAGTRSTQDRAARDRRRDHRGRGRRRHRPDRRRQHAARAAGAGRAGRRGRRRRTSACATGWRAAGCALSCAPPDSFSAMSDLKAALDRARGGGPQRHHDKSREQGKLPVRERVARLVDPGSFSRGRAAGQLGAGRLRRRRRGHRHGRGGRPPGGPDGQRPDGQGRLLGPEDGREDHPRPGAGARAPGADDLPGRLGRRAHHRPGADVPRAAAARGGSSTPR